MKTSARNEFNGKISKIISGEVMSEIKIDIAGKLKISTTITNEAKEAMSLIIGKEDSAIVKSSAIIISKEKLTAAARNIIEDSISEIKQGGVS